LRDWLRITAGPADPVLGEFPIEVPADLVDEARRQWATLLIETDGTLVDSLLGAPLPAVLRKTAAREMYRYVMMHPEHLNTSRSKALAPFLTQAEQDKLNSTLHPETPGKLPVAADEVLVWFESSYLPYRQWQRLYGTAEDAALVEDRARQFADWYFERYPLGLLGGELQKYLSFRQTLEHDQNSTTTTLVIVLDGLHAQDAVHLRGLLESAARRLSFLEQRWVFAPLPTVTVFAKDALLKGLDPRGAAAYGSLSSGVLPESKDPAPRLAEAKRGEWYIWRVMEPDETYHGYNNYDSLPIQVESALRKVAENIADIVERVPEEIALRIIVTTDHGRLLSTASREIEVPERMQSHGRAAWGVRQHEFDESGVAIEGDVAFLDGGRFGLPDDVGEMAVVIGPQMFKTNDKKKGSEAFPHGGAFPEEVIVPWMVLERDWELPLLTASINGKAAAGKPGEASLSITNPADVNLKIAEVTLQVLSGAARTVEVAAGIKPRSKRTLAIGLDLWPTSADIGAMTGHAIVQLPTGRRFEVPLTVNLESEEMYRRDTLLEDLDL
jgi:hypothetical protein